MTNGGREALIVAEKYMVIEQNKIYNDDCLRVMAAMQSGSVDFVFTDPPYNVGKDYGVHKDNLSDDEYREWMQRVVGECLRISREGVAFFVGSKTGLMFWNLLSEARAIIVRKGAIATPTPDNYYRQWSLLLVTRKPLERCYDIWDDIRMPGEGYYFREERYPHPGLTSQRLVGRIVRYFTREGETVFDPFMGTGTTAVVCERGGRKWMGSELNPEYVKIAEERLNQERAKGVLALESK